MTISAELQERYTTEMDVDWINAFRLSHPRAQPVYLVDYHEPYQGKYGGQSVTFQPVPIEFVPPKRDMSGRVEATLSMCGIAEEALVFMRQVMLNGTRPVVCHHSIFILGDEDPQLDPWAEYNLTNVAISDTVVSASLIMSMTVNRAFPGETYRLNRFPGLRRR